MSALHRSLEVYYGDPARDALMDRFYAQFVGPGDLAFDLGAHIGDRIGCFRRLGARVVAVEPQPICAQAIRALYPGDDQLTLVAAACGDQPGEVTLHVNSANPTVSTASAHFVAAAAGALGWEGQVWDTTIAVPVTTLDALIAEHGVPSFIKIDVEGYEEAVLAGLTTAVPALSFEFTTIERKVALACLERLATLGHYGFDLVLGERQQLVFGRWRSAAKLADYLRSLPHEVNSGDIYGVAQPTGASGVS
ncbi:FkbM family methyltransferase [Natronosporangium hydrolyticum]|uniref:FkbM family methyltransferase n=1 Tax=Natronosporangium hydrolyticum TaxID=2811111 RepID=A0A895YTF0_9ACTN|nr:FkbM family methyltransferase [Natronosporangium hydrolyticum]QSB17318.1 FkbM family methyltransferase [Natronosporangium hydrolyticum]